MLGNWVSGWLMAISKIIYQKRISRIAWIEMGIESVKSVSNDLLSSGLRFPTTDYGSPSHLLTFCCFPTPDT